MFIITLFNMKINANELCEVACCDILFCTLSNNVYNEYNNAYTDYYNSCIYFFALHLDTLRSATSLMVDNNRQDVEVQ